ncbi:MAG: acyltransferase family protein [Candidatus Saccharimonadales bacterium]
MRSVPRLLALRAASLAIRWGMIVGLHGFSSQVWGYHFFPATLCLFVLGSLAYHLYVRIRAWPAAPQIGTMLTIALAALAGVSLWRYRIILPTDNSNAYDTPSLWLAYVGIALCLPFLFARWQRSRIDRWIGELSYPLYIVHGLTVGIVFFIWRLPQGHMKSEIVAAVFSLVAAAVMYGLVDLPFDRWRHRRYRGAPARHEAQTPASEPITARLMP